MAPDRPGVGGTDPRRLGRLADWVEDAALVLDGLRAESAALLGISAGGPFAAACAARIPGRVRSLTLVCPLGPPGSAALAASRQRSSTEDRDSGAAVIGVSSCPAACRKISSARHGVFSLAGSTYAAR
jgi:pimeloyl-ACP methyl ester carboxylesterase